VLFGASTALHRCQDGGVPQTKWLPFSDVAIIPLRVYPEGITLRNALIFVRPPVFFVSSNVSVLNDERVSLIFEILVLHKGCAITVVLQTRGFVLSMTECGFISPV
jgi:hypothetical protein